jgi:nucleoid-associated protein EbfC
MPDMDRVMANVQALQDRLATLKDNLGETEVTGSAAGGAVAVTMTASGEFRGVRIDPELIGAETDAGDLEFLVLEALRSASAQLRELTSYRMRSLTEMLSD